MIRWTLSLLITGCLLGAAVPARAEVSGEQVRNSIEKAIKYLRREQNPQTGMWPDYAQMPLGITCLCTLAMLNAGVPPDDPQLATALNRIRRETLQQTYTVSLQTMVLCAAEPRKDLLRIRQNVSWLEQHQLRNGEKRGAWGYSPNQGSGDNSNAQFAVLALYEASRAGVPVQRQTWLAIKDYWEMSQNPDGSWGYMPSVDGTGSMTCAGVGALAMTLDRLSLGDARIDGGLVRCCGAQDEQEAIERGIQWLSRNFSVRGNPAFGRSGSTYYYYYLYGVERVGRLANRRFIGGHDWFREGAEVLVNLQDPVQGLWRGAGHAETNPHIASSLALLFLSKGRRAILCAKLKIDPADNWNRHRTDLANLTSYVEQQWKRDLTWQVIDVEQATLDDLLQTPVLVVSGATAPQFTDEQVRKLRGYIDRGGFILAESCCGEDKFEEAMHALARKIFPEPEYELRLLPPEHPIWGAEEIVDPQRLPKLYGVDAGCRTSFVFSPRQLGCYWELARVGQEWDYPPAIAADVRAARSVGINILAYATNRDVKYKLEIPVGIDPAQAAESVERGRLFVAQLRHTGGWNVAPAALPNLLRVVGQQTGLRVATDRREVQLQESSLALYHLIIMHGRQAFQFTPAERQELRRYLDRGGMLMADAICGSEAFSESFRREMAAIFPEQKLKRVPTDHSLFTTTFGGFALPTVKLRRPEPLRPGEPLKTNLSDVPPVLEGIELDDRFAVLFSPFDISCALERHDSIECPGYTREDAARLGLNIILYSLH